MSSIRPFTGVTALAACLLASLLAAPFARASEVRFFALRTHEVFVDGELDGVAVDSLGVLRLAQRVARVGEIDEPFVFAASRHEEGWVLGTGNSGRLLLLRPDGSVETLLEGGEPTLFATAVDSSGTVWTAGSPGGRVYRVADGAATVFYETGDTYVWALEPDGSGGLWIGTGTEGRIHRVAPDGSGEVVFDADDVHIRSLLVLPDGSVVAGTASEGLVLRLQPDGDARTLYDSELSEIVALARGEGGLCYAAAIESEAGFVEPTAQSGDAPGGGATVTVLEQKGSATGAAASGNGVRSRVHRFPCEGGVMETLWSFQDETIYDLLWLNGRLWIGTGQEGKVYSLRDGEAVLEKDVGERQVVGLLPDEHGPVLATTNAAALYRVLPERERSGLYTSPVLDAGEIAEFGTLHWRGEASRPESVRFAARTGMSGEPDRTWSKWSAPRSGSEIDFADLVPGRYLQLRLELAAASPSPSVSEVTVSYRQENLAPKIRTVSALEAGEILVPANFNPASQVFEPVSPSREGIFTTLAPEIEGNGQRLKTLWKQGYRTLQWEAEDPNGDQLRYRLEFRPDDVDDSWFPIVEEHVETYFSFDSTVLPDGVYRFRVTASDATGNGDGEGLETTRVTGPVAVDHSPPALGSVTRERYSIRFEVRDDLNALRQAEYSLDGRSWTPAVPRDGLLDGRSESFELTVDPEVRLVLFRAMDSFFNLASFDLTRP